MTRARDVANLLNTVDTKGDLIVATADNTVTKLPAGTNGLFLKANSAASTGLEWSAVDVAAIENNNIATIMGAVI